MTQYKRIKNHLAGFAVAGGLYGARQTKRMQTRPSPMYTIGYLTDGI